MFQNNKIPIYIQLKNAILADIKNGKYPEFSALPPVNAIADNAGVSVRTAYIAVQELIKDGICFKRPKKGTFVGDPANLTKHPVCAVWTQYNSDTPLEYPLSSVFYCGLLQGCAQNNITPVLINDAPESVIKRYDRSNEFDCKGMLVLDRDKFNKTVELAKKFPEKKFFFINYFVKKLDTQPPNMFSIVNDDYNGAYKMAEHIISHNCKDIIILSAKLTTDDRTYHDRIKGALAAFKEYSINISKKNIFLLDRTNQIQNARLSIIKLLRSGRRPQAIFCVNDLLAAGASQARSAENINNIKVTGFDHLFPNYAAEEGFATMKVPYTKMVMEALRLLDSDEKISDNIIKIQSEIIE